MRWKLTKDCLFHETDKGFFKIPEGSVFFDVPSHKQDPQIQRCMANCRRNSSPHTEFVVLDTGQGKHRVFEIGKSVERIFNRKVRRIVRCQNKS